LKEAGVHEDTTWDALDEGGRRKLVSLISLKLLEQGSALSSLEDAMAPDYFFPKTNSRAGQMTRLVNACGRVEETSLGLSMMLGEEKAYKKAESLVREYDDMLLSSVRRTVERGLSKATSIQYFESPQREVSSELCGIIMQWIGDQDKATICLTRMENEFKVSSRGTRRLVDLEGLDLSVALRDAANAVGGTGGGHNIASGATFPLGKDIDFIQALDEIVSKQMNRANAK
jgi:single-stranded-DNA-specific exonuclease